jgi:hypothetical protein
MTCRCTHLAREREGCGSLASRRRGDEDATSGAQSIRGILVRRVARQDDQSASDGGHKEEKVEVEQDWVPPQALGEHARDEHGEQAERRDEVDGAIDGG